MSVPIPLFAFSPDGLSITFLDRSSGSPAITAWAWDFGDSTTSAVQNPPVHDYPIPGIYTVKLRVTNTDGQATYSFDLVASTAPGLNVTIKGMVGYELPVGITWDETGFQQTRMKWQIWLQEAAGIDDDDIFDETKWPQLYNVLISKLIVYDLILRAANVAMNNMIGLSSTASSTTLTPGTVKGPLKSLKTGPSEAQWYDSSTLWASIFRSAAQGGGTFSTLLSDICLYARRVQVQMPFCGPAPKRVRPFVIARGKCQVNYDERYVEPQPFPSGLPPFWTDQQW